MPETVNAAFSIINPGVAAFLAIHSVMYDVKDSLFCELKSQLEYFP